MSMSEFDTQMNSGEDDSSSHSEHRQALPPDFSEEDVAFAEVLDTLFSPEQEILPPYFVQTLLDSEDPRFRPVEYGFEKKTSARVFRRLKLRRRLFYSHSSPREVIGSGISGIAAQRSLLALVTTLMLIMVFTVAFTAPSFASGMALLLQGGRSGVYQVQRYPQGVKAPSPPLEDISAEPQRMSILAAQQQLHFNMYWPQMVPHDYYLASIFLETDQQWSDGPILDLVYNLKVTKDSLGDTPQIVVREFKPGEEVLQSVQDGAAHPLERDQNGLAKAIYVDGQWNLGDGQTLPQWAYHGRGELIYLQDNVVFWIAGDQHYGIGEKALMSIAQSLQIFHISHQMHMFGENRLVTQVIDYVPDQFATDVLLIIPDGGTDSPYYISVSSYQSVKTTQKIVAAGH